MDLQQARDFADRWLQAWNAHDLDAVLSHFTDDVVFTSPVAAQLLPETGGRLVGKDALRAYWTTGLERIPDLHFSIEGLFLGLDVLVISYRNHVGTLVNEVLHLTADGLVDRGDGTYPTGDAAAASGA